MKNVRYIILRKKVGKLAWLGNPINSKVYDACPLSVVRPG
jgi:hypothetical protein